MPERREGGPASAVAIDVHVHALAGSLPERGAGGMDSLTGSGARALGGDEADTSSVPTIPQIAEEYRRQDMAAVIFPVDSETATGRQPLDQAAYLDAVEAERDVLIPFISVDPWKGKRALAQVAEACAHHDVRGVKFHPCTQAFEPNDRRFYPLYGRLESLGLVALFHTGQTGIGKGLPGGGGIRLKYGNPLLLDDIAVDFPGLKIIMAHPSVPWQDEALAVALHKPTVYIDLSGWSPKYFPPNLVRYAKTMLKDRVLFGTDYPYITAERWLSDFELLEFPADVKERILRTNAIELLGLNDADTTQGEGP